MELTDLKKLGSAEEACLELGKILGLTVPVTENVLYKALEDEDYGRNLVIASRDPQMLDMLMQFAPERPRSEEGFTNLQLIGKAAKAFFDWGKAGFSTVTDDIYAKRLAACYGCDQLSEAPDQLVYKISLKKNEDKRTCKSCGCVVARKARLTNDTCPLEDPANPGLNRWGESRSKAPLPELA